MSREYICHADTGCDKARAVGYNGRCLECPLDHCLEDDIKESVSRTSGPRREIYPALERKAE